jgi:hypothetical protein
MPPSIFDYIKSEESKFDSDEVQIGENWYWNFKKHVQLIFHLKNGVFFTGENNWMRAFKNIMQPILDLAYWTEDLEVKDVIFFIENQFGKVLSFLVKKYYDEVYTREHDLDTLFDEITESDIDYGGVLVQRGEKRPEVLQLNSVAFCDQTDILGGVIGFKFNFSPAKLRSMSKAGWGDEKNGATISIEDLIVLATQEKSPIGTNSQKTNISTGKTIEVYVVRGSMPDHYLNDSNDMEYHCPQVQIVAFYLDKDSKRQGVTLYRKEDDGKSIKFHTSKKVFQRALGRGVGESLLHPQIWTNFLTIHKTGMLEAGSKVGLYTDDPSYSDKNKIQNMGNLEITTIDDGKKINIIPTIEPAKIQLFGNDINDWYNHAQLSGAANDPLMGVEAASGTTFKGQERSVAQGRGSHDRRRGQRAKFIEEIHRDWIIPDIIKEITKGKKFMATLSTEELTWVADSIAEHQTNKRIIDLILENKTDVNAESQATFKELFKKDFLKKGNKHLLEIIKGEFADMEVKMGINIAGKQKNLADLSDKVLSIFQFIFQNPQGFMQAMQVPALAKSFENLLEFSGMSIGDFSSLIKPMEQSMQPQQIGQAGQGGQAPTLALNQPTQ